MTSRRHSVRFAAVGLAMSGLMALAACGGDDSGDDTTTTVAVETTVVGEPTPGSDDTTAPEDTVVDPAGDETTTTIDTSDVEALSADECRDLYDRFVDLGFDPSSDAEPEDTDEVFASLEDAAPDDLKGDIQVLRDAFKTLSEAEAEHGSDVSNPEYLEALETLGTPEFAAASARLEAFFANCEDAVGD